MTDDETRMTDPVTGGQKGAKQEQLGSVDPVALQVLGLVSGFGCNKYSPFNFLKGYAWSLSFNAMMRHSLKFWAGETNDPQSGLPHMGHAAWHALAMVSFAKRGIGADDRPAAEGALFTEETKAEAAEAAAGFVDKPVRTSTVSIGFQPVIRRGISWYE